MYLSLKWLSPETRWGRVSLVCTLFVVLTVGFALAFIWSNEGIVFELYSPRQLIGTTMMFVLLPTYLLWSVQQVWMHNNRYLEKLHGLVAQAALAAVLHKLSNAPWYFVLFVLFGAWCGAAQNFFLVDHVNAGEASSFDVAFLSGNIIIWSMVGFLLSWRLNVCLALVRLGVQCKVNLYDLGTLKPFTAVATGNVLVVMGALAFITLQSLDAEFRLVNYQAGAIVGLIAAITLFVLPLLGIRRRIQLTKVQHIADLQAQLNATSNTDIAKLEILSAHLERIKSIHNIPVDVALITRIFGYVIIPPIAWVAGAIVENFIDGL